MKVEINKEQIETKKVEITIDNQVYTLTKTVDGRLQVMKDHGDEDDIAVYPGTANVIQIK
jgi:hypothetical protein